MSILTPPGSNTKLGPNVQSWSRPVGPTCPKECPFLSGVLPSGELLPSSDLCYAVRLENSVPEVKEAWAKNAEGTDWIEWSKQLCYELREAGKVGRVIRIHVGGDILKADGELDRDYLYAIFRAFHYSWPDSPQAFIYTHAWKKLDLFWQNMFKRAGIELFASVHGEKDAEEARAMGFRLAIDGGYMPAEGWPAWRNPGELNCPEQRLGHEKINCSSCKYCFRKGKGDVVFYRHWPGAPNYVGGGKHVEK